MVEGAKSGWMGNVSATRAFAPSTASRSPSPVPLRFSGEDHYFDFNRWTASSALSRWRRLMLAPTMARTAVITAASSV